MIASDFNVIFFPGGKINGSAVPVNLKNRPRIPTPDVTKEVMAAEHRLSTSSPSPLASNSHFNPPPGYAEMSSGGQLLLTPIQETEGSPPGMGSPGTAALAQAVLSPALTSAGIGQMGHSQTAVTLTPVTVSQLVAQDTCPKQVH